MKRLEFEDRMDEIAAAFGKKTPEPRVLNAIWSRVESLPDAFMAFARDKLCEQEKLPANLGRFLRHELWPEYQEQNPQETRKHSFPACPLCDPDSPGLRSVWDEYDCPRTIACECCTDPRLLARFPRMSDMELRALGLKTRSQWLAAHQGSHWRREKIMHDLEEAARNPREVENPDEIEYF